MPFHHGWQLLSARAVIFGARTLSAGLWLANAMLRTVYFIWQFIPKRMALGQQYAFQSEELINNTLIHTSLRFYFALLCPRTFFFLTCPL